MELFNQLKAFFNRDASNAQEAELAALKLIAQGNNLEDDRKLSQAMQCYDAAILLAPNVARPYLSRGNILLSTGDTNGALSAYAMALARDPGYAAAHYNSGNALLRLGQREAALSAYNKAIELKPDFVDAWVARGGVLEDVERLDDSVQSYREALAIQPHYAEAHSNLGNVFKASGQFDAAMASYRRAVELKPDYPGVHNNLGNIFRDFGQFDSAEASFRRALELDPVYVDAFNNLGNVLQELGRFDDAVASYRRALELDPDFAPAHNNLGNAFAADGQFKKAAESYRQALRLDPDYLQACSNLLFLEDSHPDDGVTPLPDAQYFGKLVQRKARTTSTWLNVPDPARSIRLGFVSGDFWAHPVGYFIESILASLASDAAGKLELYAYHSHFCNDEITERLKSHCHGWRSAVGVTDASLAQIIRDDAIDILIDLSGHTAHNRLAMFAWKPAPVQVSWLGYFATTGVPAIDYLIADPWTIPIDQEANFTETIWRLPETRLCFTAPDVCLPVTALPALGNGYVTFACFNNLTKMSDTVVALWAKVLTSVPDSRLFLKSKQLKETSVQQRTLARFKMHGIDTHRLRLEGPSPRAEYLAAYQRVDIALDPFPYTGGTTTAEALWMGVPVLTLTGKSFLSRQGLGLLLNAGLPEWVATDADDYVARAVAHASDLNRLAALRHLLRLQITASPLFDGPRFARHFQIAMREMWSNWCEKNLLFNPENQSL